MRSEPRGPYTDEMMRSDVAATLDPQWYTHVALDEWHCPARLLHIARKRWNWTDDQVFRSGIVAMPTRIEAKLIAAEMRKMFSEFPGEFDNGEFIRSHKRYVQPVWDGRTIVGLKHVNF